MSSWVGTAVQAFPARIGTGLIDLFLRCAVNDLTAKRRKPNAP
jgi:hypothetical protein